MRNLCLAAGLALVASNALAADFGIGVSARSDDGMLYLPIDVSKALRIEPNVRYGSSEATTGGVTQKTDTLEIGFGLFGSKQVTEAAHLYYGGRVAYVESTGTSLIPGPFGTFTTSELKQDGYRIGPTLGFEYLFGGHFSVGGEASYSFLRIAGEADNGRGSTNDVEQKTHGTQTRLIFRYMF